MAKARPPGWAKLWSDCFALGIELQAVIGLRMMKIAAGGKASEAEILRMIVEKSQAAMAAQYDTAMSVLTGNGHRALGNMVRGYRRKVRRNRKRLSRNK